MTQRRAVLGLGLASLGLMTASCGGGGGLGSVLADVGSGGTGSTTIGPVSGFGSVIVGGLRYDDSAASITDDSGASVASSALGLGMMVRIDGTLSDASNGKATSIRVTSQLLGAVDSVDATAGSLGVLGQTVNLTATTVYAGFTSLAGLAVGSTVEVWGVLDAASASVAATRVELKAAATGSYKLTGAVTAVNASASRCTIGALAVDFAGANLRDLASVTVGGLLRVRSVLAPSGGVLVASAVEAVNGFGGAPGDDPAGSGKDGNQLEIEGVVSGRVAGSARFVVAGVNVDATGATFSGGTLAALANGDRAQVGGAVKAGVLVATEVELKSDDDASAQEFEVHGVITSFASKASFVVRGVTVDASGSGVKFSDGTAASLKLGVKVEIKGFIGADGSTLVATEVAIDD